MTNIEFDASLTYPICRDCREEFEAAGLNEQGFCSNCSPIEQPLSFHIFLDELETAIYACISLNNYNKECFGTSDLKLAHFSTMLLAKFPETLVEQGYNPYRFIQPTFSKFGYNLDNHYKEEDFANAKELLAEDFKMDLTHYERIMGMGKYIRETNTDLEEFLKSNKYR